MADNTRTRAELEAMFDSEGLGNISGQDDRDFIKSVHLLTDLDQMVTVAKAGGQYTTIQAGINAAVSGNTVLVYPGEYDEAITLKNGVDVVAINPENTKILRQVTDNLVECHCYLKIAIDNQQSDETSGIHLGNVASEIIIYGNITGSSGSVAGAGIDSDGAKITVYGNVTGGDGDEGGHGIHLGSTGEVIVFGNISSGICASSYAIYLSSGTFKVNSGTISSQWNNASGHAVRIYAGFLILQNCKLICTHADAKSIYASNAQDAYCMRVDANRDDDANITQKIANGFNFDINVR